MEKIIVFKIKFYEATQTKNRRIRILELSENWKTRRQSDIIDYDYNINCMYTQAKKYLNNIGIKIEYEGGGYLMSKPIYQWKLI